MKIIKAAISRFTSAYVINVEVVGMVNGPESKTCCGKGMLFNIERSKPLTAFALSKNHLLNESFCAANFLKAFSGSSPSIVTTTKEPCGVCW
jgi:hypothetical protein